MEFLVLVSFLCILILPSVLTPCASLQVHLQSSNKQSADINEIQVSLTTLPRKLRFTEVAVSAQEVNKDSTPDNKQKENVLAGGKRTKIFHKEEEENVQVVQRSKGTWQEWMEGEKENTSEYFTMDYTHVRRRRPIHNKSLPAFP